MVSAFVFFFLSCPTATNKDKKGHTHTPMTAPVPPPHVPGLVALLAGALIPCLNVFVFVVIQTWFFWRFGSEEVLTVLLGKTRSLSEARRILRRTDGLEFPRRCLDTAVAEAHQRVHAGWDPEREEAQRLARNRALIVRWVQPWVLAAGSAALLCLVLMILWCALGGRSRFRERWGALFGAPMWVGLLLVFLGYAGEILLFLLVIERYIMFGDLEIARLILGASPAGAGYFDDDATK